MSLSTFDLIIVAIYAMALLSIALWVSREPSGHAKDTQDYFLAGKSLPWWAIGASLIAANISAEQIIGQSGQGFVVGLAIAAYEWQAALVLLVVAVFFLPVFLKRGIYTMPQFLETRFGPGVKTIMAIFWIFLFTAVNLTTVLYGGALAIQAVTGLGVFTGMTMLAVFALVYSLYGGLKAVALTDMIQVVILIFGGLAITHVVLGMVGGGNGPLAGLSTLTTALPGHFEMILDRDHPQYSQLPGIWTLLGGLWVLHFSYWGFNQYIIQRALGAESLPVAQRGLAFAALLKFLIPLIVVIPGIAALWLAQDGLAGLSYDALSQKPDSTYGALMALMPVGIRGLIFAALIAAIVSSLASMINSISTIFTMDIYRDYVRTGSDEQHYVMIGRITAIVAMMIALFLAIPLLGAGDSIFQAIQEYTGFVAPGIVAVFLLGFFWKRANTTGAFALLVSSVVLSFLFFAAASPDAVGSGLSNGVAGALAPVFNPLLGLADFSVTDMPFVVRIWFIFLICLLVGVVASLVSTPPRPEQPVDLSDINFDTTTGFKISAAFIIAILIGLYALLW
ncbi:MAG: sodium transporter [Hyphomonadaceae bacterium]|nr:sodium transporter [Hyphomonadaceae bacterium]OUX93068.1 MAG: sodium transporter [Hyphomonas sp. TMED17]